jgi:tripartite-type tricarboxylate transporter receptor subunit TctC
MTRLLIAVLAVTFATFAPLAGAQSWPAKPIRLVLQFPPGGSTDLVARILGQALSQSLGQPVLVENKPGADGAIAGDFVARAEPDGYTYFLASNTAMMQVPLLKKNAPYDAVKSFTPVSLVGRYVYLLVAAPSLPAKNVAELLAYARANPGRLNYGSYSGVTQLMHANLRLVSKLDIALIPYKGEAPTVVDIIGGQVHFTFATPTSTLAHIRDGKLRALATLLPARFALLPEVPTAAEAGLPPFTAGTWAALFGPAKLPSEITARMNKELNAAMKRPDVREKIGQQGFDLGGSSPEELAAFVQDQLGAWGRAFREAGMQPE